MATCPDSGKIIHATKGDAWVARKKLMRDKPCAPDLLPYPCGTHWHIGHSERALNARIKRALKRG